MGIDTNPEFCQIVGKTAVPGTSNRWNATLKLRNAKGYKPCLIIDGQHRLAGIINSSRDTYPVAVTGLLDPSLLVQMSNFYVINNKAARVSTAHTNELLGAMADLSSTDKNQLDAILGQLGIKNIDAQAFVSALNESGMVFSGLLDFPSNKLQLVSSLELKNLIDTSRRVNFLSFIEDDDPLQLTCYNNMWKGVKEAFLDRWNLELAIAQDVIDKKRPKQDLNTNKKLFHSGAIAVLGMELDKQLASLPYRRKWQSEPSAIMQIVSTDILGSVPKTFWNDKQIDNTAKGKREFQLILEKSLLS